MPAACAPKRNAPLYRLEGTRPVQIASSAGTLTPLSVDEGRILVDHEDGTLELLDSEGAALRTFHTDTPADGEPQHPSGKARVGTSWA